MRGSAVFRTGVAPGGALAGPWAKNELWRKARAVPSLDLRFADNKSLVDATTGQNLVTFTRASSGTFVGSDGVLRSAVTNLLLRSEEFETTWTLSAATVTPNATTAPNGTNTADKLVETATTAAHYAQQIVTVTSGTSYTLSVFAKAGERSSLVLLMAQSTSPFTTHAVVDFNLTNGTVISTSAGSGTIAPVGDGWYRCTATGTTTSTGEIVRYSFATVGDGTSGLFLWGAQLEQSTTAGEYIPTTSTINSAPRFDHNPTTGESLGLLVEEQRTNLLLRSEEFDNAGWTQAFLNKQVTANSVTAPNGLIVADTVATANATAEFGIGQSATVVANIPTTISIFAKAAASNFVYLRFYGAATNLFYTIIVNLSTGIVTNTGTGTSTTGVSDSVTAFPNGWYRISCTATHNNVTQFLIAGPCLSGTQVIGATFGDIVSVGTGNESVYLYGAQLEQGAFPTSYIPTTTAAATRSADVASITGSAFSGFYRQDEGSFFCSTFAPKGVVVYGTGDTFDNTQYIFVGSSNNVFIRSGGVFVASLTAPISTTTVTNIAHGYAANNFAGVSNGGAISTNTSGAVPLAQVRLKLGSSAWESDGSNNINGTIRRLCYWPTRLANNVLQSITQ